jgi:hypothetical protein
MVRTSNLAFMSSYTYLSRYVGIQEHALASPLTFPGLSGSWLTNSPKLSSTSVSMCWAWLVRLMNNLGIWARIPGKNSNLDTYALDIAAPFLFRKDSEPGNGPNLI